MKLVIIGLSSRVISGRPCGKWIHIPSRIADFCSVHRIGIHVSMCRLKHLLTRSGIITCKLPFHFNFIKAQGNYQFYAKHWPINCWINQKCCKKQDEYAKRERMTPNKLQYFYGGIQYTLKFLTKLHVDQQFSLIKYRITQKLLTVFKLCKVILNYIALRCRNTINIIAFKLLYLYTNLSLRAIN